MANKTESAVEKIVEELLEGTEIFMVDVEFVKERDWYLRVFIDRPGGIDIEDCAEISGRIEKILDEKNIISENYILEVSSPGLDRALKKERDFIREMGKTVDVSLYEPLNGKKVITGELAAYDKSTLTLRGHPPLSTDKIAGVHLHIDF